MGAMPPTPYDLVPYPAAPRRETHPDALAAMATLFGLRPPPIEAWRVLEVGCSDGGNVLPMAVGLPEARFLGIDLAAPAVERGRDLARRAGLANVELRVEDLRALETAGPFDAIIAVGVFSWVPAEVRRALLALIGRHLAPAGVACVSWNALPGWRERGRVRRLLLERTAHLGDLGERVRAARAILGRIGDELPDLPAKERAYLQDVVEDAHLAHDLLAEVNEPLGIRDFLALAAEAGLAYLAEADLAGTAPTPAAPLDDAARIALEEAHDDARGRSFRRTLLRRADAPVATALGADSLRALHVASAFEAPLDPVLRPLHEAWPRALPFEALRLAQPGQDAEATAAAILAAVRGRRAELRLRPLLGADRAGARPVASPLARLLAVEREAVPNLRHARVRLSARERALLPLLDGRRDRGALAHALGWDADALDAALRRLARAGLILEADRGPQGHPDGAIPLS